MPTDPENADRCMSVISRVLERQRPGAVLTRGKNCEASLIEGGQN
jgi:hypothetical protein